jgi:glycerol-3-phosphate acyltransferase PlsY
MEQTLAAIAVVVLAYLMGSIPSGLLVGRAFTGKDVRDVGSGNIGAANVSRLGGFRLAVFVLVLDLLKGVIPVLIGRLVGLSSIELCAVAAAAVLGHDFSLFLKFRGGKGVATTLGVVLALSPVVAVVAALVWLLVLGISKYSSLASLVALFALPVIVAAADQPAEYVPLTMGLALLALYTHRDNVNRLNQGKESRLVSRRLG